MSLTEIFRSLGRSDALALRKEAASLTGTQIIDREVSIPPFDPTKDYSGWDAGAPVTDEGQVWALLQPYNAAWYPGGPSQNRALWSLLHTTNPARAKPWVDPLGTSGVYLKDECYRDENGTVWRCLEAQTAYPASAVPWYWEEVSENGTE